MITLDVDEGTLQHDFRGRTWEVSVQSATEFRTAAANQREQEKERRRAQQVKEDGSRLLNALDSMPHGHPERGAVLTQIRTTAGLSGDRMSRAVLALMNDRIVEEVPIELATGRDLKVKTAVRGLRRRCVREGNESDESRIRT